MVWNFISVDVRHEESRDEGDESSRDVVSMLDSVVVGEILPSVASSWVLCDKSSSPTRGSGSRTGSVPRNAKSG